MNAIIWWLYIRKKFLEAILLPFPSALFTIALVYRFLTPLLSGGKVALRPGSVRRYLLFSLGASVVFAVLYCMTAMGAALLLLPFLRDYDVNNDVKWYWIGFVFRVVVCQCLFFAFNLLAGKFFKHAVMVEGRLNAWKAAWAPAIVIVSTIALLSYLINKLFPPQ